MAKVGRPSTRTVIREEIVAAMPSIIEAFLKAQGGTVPPVAQAPKAMPEAPKVGRKVVADAQGVERPPEGGYADTFEFIASNAVGEPRIKLGSYVVPEEILAQNVNVYFWNSQTGRSVKPVPQARAALLAAGFKFSTRLGDKPKGGPARWYGDRRTLPSFCIGGEVKVRTIK